MPFKTTILNLGGLKIHANSPPSVMQFLKDKGINVSVQSDGYIVLSGNFSLRGQDGTDFLAANPEANDNLIPDNPPIIHSTKSQNSEDNRYELKTLSPIKTGVESIKPILFAATPQKLSSFKEDIEAAKLGAAILLGVMGATVVVNKLRSML